jgi:membrane protein DedA with SNARE-associated domain
LFDFSGVVAAGVGVPIPEELPLVGAGIWVAGDPPVGAWKWLILPICILGVVISDGLLYGVGRFWGPALLNFRWVRKMLPPEKQERIIKNFHDYGVKILLFARLLPGIRSPIFIMAGILKLPLKRFIFADGIYAIPGVSLLFFLSYWLRDQFRDLIVAFEKKVDHARPILILLALVGVAAYLVWHFWRKPVSTGDPKELPPIIDKVVKKHSPLDTVVERLAPGKNPPSPEKDQPPPAPSADGQGARSRESEQGTKPATNSSPPNGAVDGQTRPKESAPEPPRKREETV